MIIDFLKIKHSDTHFIVAKYNGTVITSLTRNCVQHIIKEIVAGKEINPADGVGSISSHSYRLSHIVIGAEARITIVIVLKWDAIPQINIGNAILRDDFGFLSHAVNGVIHPKITVTIKLNSRCLGNGNPDTIHFLESYSARRFLYDVAVPFSGIAFSHKLLQ